MYEADSKARNRENQRRSRQRQKDYIQSLEDQLAQHQRHGTRASQALQTAARHVADENVKLRQLLTLLGASPALVDAYLDGSLPEGALDNADLISQLESQDSSSTGDGTTLAGEQKTVAGLTTVRAQASPLTAPSSATASPTQQGLESPLRYEVGGCSDLTAHPSQDAPVLLLHDSEAPTAAAVRDTTSEAAAVANDPDSSCTPYAPGSPRTPARDGTDCEDAARIIASMRGGGHPDAVRATELGCIGNARCMIANSHIFDLIDK